MIQFPKTFRYTFRHKIDKWRILSLLIVAVFLISACGTTVANTNWPGISVKDNVVYVAYGPAVVAVDVVSEEQVWLYRPTNIQNAQLFAQPSLDGQTIVVGDYGESGGLLNPKVTVGIYGLDDQELDNISGTMVPEEVWRNDTAAGDRIVAGPLQVGEKAYVGTADNFMLALDQSQGGALQWQFEAEKPVWSTAEYQDGILYVASMDGNIYALDAENGEERWRQSLGGAIAANLELQHGLLYANSYNSSANALDPGTGEIVWQVETSSAVWGGSAISESDAFFVDLNGQLFAVDARTGNVKWTEEIGELVQTTPAYSDGVLYVATAGRADVENDQQEGTLIAFSADDGEELWRERTGFQLFSGPLVVGDSVVVGLTDETGLLLVFDRQDGSLTWEFDRPQLGEE